MRISILLLVLFAATPALALNCQPQPTCAALNYTASSCGGEYLNCPYDSSKKNCTEDCTGFTLASCPTNCNCEKGCSKYKITSAKDGYQVSNNTCVSACQVGSVYYSDGTCTSGDNIDTSKTAIGVVFHSNNGHGLYVDLKDLSMSTNYPTYYYKVLYSNLYDADQKQLPWGMNDTGFPTISVNIDELTAQLKAGSGIAFDGRDHTNTVINRPYAGYYACCYQEYTYQACLDKGAHMMDGVTAEDTDSWIQIRGNFADHCYATAALGTRMIGQTWYLPSIGELALLYGYTPSQVTSSEGASGATGDTLSKVNATLNKLFGAQALSSNYYWSSTPVQDVQNSSAWGLDMSNGYRSRLFRYTGYRVRAINSF